MCKLEVSMHMVMVCLYVAVVCVLFCVRAFLHTTRWDGCQEI